MSLMHLAANVSVFLSQCFGTNIWDETLPYISLSWMLIERKKLSEEAVYPSAENLEQLENNVLTFSPISSLTY